jgi:hypothetical protein
MNILYKNIIGNSPVEIFQLYSKDITFPKKAVVYCTIDKISLCNVHATNKAVVNLYVTRTYISENENRTYVGQNGNYNALETTTDTFYILKNLCIPVGATLILDKEDFNITYNNYNLFINLNDPTSTVDVILYESTDALPIETFTNTKGYY